MAINLKNRKTNKHIIALVVLTVIIVFIMFGFINSSFLLRFFRSMRESSLESVFESIYEKSENENIYSSAFSDDFQRECERENVSGIIFRPDGRVVTTTENSISRMTDHMYLVLFKGEGEAVVKSDRFFIIEFADTVNENSYLVLVGSLSDGNTVCFETAMATVIDAATISRRIVIIFAFFLIAFWTFMWTIVSVRDLRQENERLESDIKTKEKNEMMRREFISNVSHELKTPISLIMGYTDGLLEDDISNTKEKRTHYAETILDEAERMDALLSQLLELNELEYGIQQTNIKKLNLTNIVKEEIYSLLVLAENADVNIEIDLQPDVFVFSDEILTRQVIDNYITNAIKYTQNEKKVEVFFGFRDEKVILNVFDTGEGLSEEECVKIWDKFYKVDKARTRQINSSGIGLSVVKAAAESLEEEYGVYNMEDGIVFYFTFSAKEI